jgi:hypothetical protein
MRFTREELIARARVYVDDDHLDQKSWIKEERWFELAAVEYIQLYKRWVRMGLINPPIVEELLTGPSTNLTGEVMAIVGVAQYVDGLPRVLANDAAELGHDHTWGDSGDSGPAISWAAEGTGDELTIHLYPPPSDTNYVVRYVPTVDPFVDIEHDLESGDPPGTIYYGAVDLPFGADERLVLGIARRAHLKDSGSSQLLERLIQEADAELAFAAAGKSNGPRVRRAGANPYSTPTRASWPPRESWRYY